MAETRTSVRIASGVVGALLATFGALGLYNLQGAGGDELFVLQAYPLLGVLGGISLLYAATRSPETFRTTVSRVLGVGALVAIGTGGYSTYVGYTGPGPLARLFLGLGIVGMAIGMVVLGFAWRLGRAATGSQVR